MTDIYLRQRHSPADGTALCRHYCRGTVGVTWGRYVVPAWNRRWILRSYVALSLHYRLNCSGRLQTILTHIKDGDK